MLEIAIHLKSCLKMPSTLKVFPNIIYKFFPQVQRNGRHDEEAEPRRAAVRCQAIHPAGKKGDGTAEDDQTGGETS